MSRTAEEDIFIPTSFLPELEKKGLWVFGTRDVISGNRRSLTLALYADDRLVLLDFLFAISTEQLLFK